MKIHDEFEVVWESVQDGEGVEKHLTDDADKVYLSVEMEEAEESSLSLGTWLLVKFHDLFGWDFPDQTEELPREGSIVVGDDTMEVDENPRTDVQHLIGTVVALTGCEYDPTYENGEAHFDITLNNGEDQDDGIHGDMGEDADISDCPYFD